jgi:hypothetical protein
MVMSHPSRTVPFIGTAFRVLVLAACAGLGAWSLAAEGDLRLEYPWATLRADADTQVTCGLPQDFVPGERISWRLASENNRTLASGETVPAAAGNAQSVSFSMQTPPVRDGVMLEASLQVRGAGAAPGEPRVRTLWILPPDPFAVAPDQWKKRNVRIYDPEDSLTPRLETLSLAHEVIDNPDTLVDVRDGVLVVGEGISFREMPALWDTLNRVAASGVPVLCLTPADGTVEMPGTAETSLPAPRRVTWRRSDVAADLHACLAWPSAVDGKPTLRPFSLRGEGASVMIDMAGHDPGWPWLEIDYAAPRGKLILCGMSLGQHWEASPTPAWLFAAMMEYLVANKPAFPGASQ